MLLQGECQKNTLIDGIIVEDEDHGRKVARYLAFDILFVDGNPVWQKKLEKRLQCLQNEVILPRKNVRSWCLPLDSQNECQHSSSISL